MHVAILDPEENAIFEVAIAEKQFTNLQAQLLGLRCQRAACGLPFEG